MPYHVLTMNKSHNCLVWSFRSGDVKYHLGTSNKITLSNGRTVHLSLSANPSHLEAVNPVVVGKTRAKQLYTRDTERTKCMGSVTPTTHNSL